MVYERDIKVSIVTPVFNQSDTLKETIESVLSQTYLNIEYIIVNDGSTDDVLSIINDYKDKLTLISQSNHGQAHALNKGWSIASGDYLCYLSADDIIYPACIQEIVSQITDEYIVYYPDYHLINASSNIIKKIQSPDYNKGKLIYELMCQPGISALFSSMAFHSIGGWNCEYKFVPDLEFWIRMSSQGNFKRIPKTLGGFRVHGKSGSLKIVSYELSEEPIKIANNHLNACSDKNKKRLLFHSRLISARSHLQSKRFIKGFSRYIEAIFNNPTKALNIHNLKFILNGIFRRFYYKTYLNK